MEKWWLMLGITVAALWGLGAKLRPEPVARQEPESTVKVRFLVSSNLVTEPVIVTKVKKPEAVWRAQLTPEQYQITRAEGTERAFCGVFHDNHKKGIYTCIGCGLPLFRSDAKFDSGTGWPSFFQPFALENIGQKRDTRFGMVRTEVHCIRCGSHLGHLFNDGPAPTGLRYCINSDALTFHERPKQGPTQEKVLLGAGCFWGAEETFRRIPGVVATRVGFAGGHVPNPSYEQVCTIPTAHAEVVEVVYDSAQVGLETILEALWTGYDCFSPVDAGNQYRSAIYFYEPEQEAIARASAGAWEQKHPGKKVATEIALAWAFYPAEEYHQRYYEKRGLEPPMCAVKGVEQDSN